MCLPLLSVRPTWWSWAIQYNVYTTVLRIHTLMKLGYTAPYLVMKLGYTAQCVYYWTENSLNLMKLGYTAPYLVMKLGYTAQCVYYWTKNSLTLMKLGYTAWILQVSLQTQLWMCISIYFWILWRQSEYSQG